MKTKPKQKSKPMPPRKFAKAKKSKVGRIIAKRSIEKSKRAKKTAAERRALESQRPSKAKPKAKKTVRRTVSIPVEYRGVRHVPKSHWPAVDRVIEILRDVDKVPGDTDILLHGEFAKVKVRGVDGEIWSIDEISYQKDEGKSGSSYFGSMPECLGLFRAVEHYLGLHFVPVQYPSCGSGSVVDERGDAEWRLRQVLGAMPQRTAKVTHGELLDLEEAEYVYRQLFGATQLHEVNDDVARSAVEEAVRAKLYAYISAMKGNAVDLRLDVMKLSLSEAAQLASLVPADGLRKEDTGLFSRLVHFAKLDGSKLNINQLLAIDYEQAKCVIDWMTADNDETAEDPESHYTIDEKNLLTRLRGFVEGCEKNAAEVERRAADREETRLGDIAAPTDASFQPPGETAPAAAEQG